MGGTSKADARSLAVAVRKLFETARRTPEQDYCQPGLYKRIQEAEGALSQCYPMQC